MLSFDGAWPFSWPFAWPCVASCYEIFGVGIAHDGDGLGWKMMNCGYLTSHQNWRKIRPHSMW